MLRIYNIKQNKNKNVRPMINPYLLCPSFATDNNRKLFINKYKKYILNKTCPLFVIGLAIKYHRKLVKLFFQQTVFVIFKKKKIVTKKHIGDHIFYVSYLPKRRKISCQSLIVYLEQKIVAIRKKKTRKKSKKKKLFLYSLVGRFNYSNQMRYGDL